MREMKITTFNGVSLRIRFMPSDERCWELLVPADVDLNHAIGQALFKDDDVTETLADGMILVYSRSLTRLMELIAEYVGRTEF